MTLRQFQAYLNAQSQPIDRRLVFTLEAFGVERSEIMKMPLKDTARKVSEISKALEARKPRLETFITIDGVEYGLHPDVLGATTGEFIDLTSLDPKFWPTAHKAMAILYRPVVEKKGSKYRIEKYTGKEVTEADKFLDLDLEIVDGFAAFFLTLATELELTLTTYSLSKITQALKTPGRGTPWFTTLRGRFLRWIRLLTSRYTTS